jgi:hypothetical protein
MSETQKAWLYHRGQWLEIDDPIDDLEGWYAVESAEENARGKRTFFLKPYGYESHEWGLGFGGFDTFNIDIYQRSLKGPAKATLPSYLLVTGIFEFTERFYAQDLPDLLQVLSLLAPMITAEMIERTIKEELLPMLKSIERRLPRE